MLFRVVKKILYELGKWHEHMTDTYKPQYKGQWKNKGKDSYEDWQWVEKKGKHCVVNVFQLENDYIITVGRNMRPSAIESVECRDERELEIALHLLKVYYGTLGNVVTDTSIQ